MSDSMSTSSPPLSLAGSGPESHPVPSTGSQMSSPVSGPVSSPATSPQLLTWWQRWGVVAGAALASVTLIGGAWSLALGAGDSRWERIESARSAREEILRGQAARDGEQDRAQAQALELHRGQIAPLERRLEQLDERSRWTLILLQQLAAERRTVGPPLPAPPPELLAPAPAPPGGAP